MQNFDCFLLSYNKYGESDAFLHCYTAEEGYQTFFAKSIYSTKNKKKPYLFPLNQISISIIKRGVSKGVPTVSKLELPADYGDFQEVKTNVILFFVAEFLHQILREEGKNEYAFLAIQKFREEMLKNNLNSYITLLFNFLKISGIAPLHSEEQYLDPESGNFTDSVTHALFDEEISGHYKTYLSGNDSSGKVKRQERNKIVDSLMIYYSYHFSGFRTPNSLTVLRQIFE